VGNLVESEKVGEQKLGQPVFFFKWGILRGALSALFFFAAFMKGAQILTEPSPGEGLFSSRLFTTVLVLWEFALALWLLSGFFPRLTCYVLILLFSVFTLYSLYRAFILKAESCNCYGALKVNPLAMACLDLFLVFILIFFRKRVPKGRVPRIGGLISIAAIWLFAAVPFLYFLNGTETKAISQIGVVQEASSGKKTILLQPESWPGGDFVLANYTDIQEELSQGLWIFLVYNNSCSSCRGAVRIYQETAVKYAQTPDFPKIAMIELPPYRTGNTNSPALCGKLDRTYRWRIQGPALILLDNAKVQTLFPNALDAKVVDLIWGAAQ
jgi:uncharacterized membrane protein YphA (DoxX/SURF4 family)